MLTLPMDRKPILTRRRVLNVLRSSLGMSAGQALWHTAGYAGDMKDGTAEGSAAARGGEARGALALLSMVAASAPATVMDHLPILLRVRASCVRNTNSIPPDPAAFATHPALPLTLAFLQPTRLLHCYWI